MRRQDRAVTDFSAMLDVVRACDCCRITIADKDCPYLVPMNFGYTVQGETLTLYFHCAAQGKKLDLIDANSYVAFEMDCDHRLIRGERACDYTYAYRSVIGKGRISRVSDVQAQTDALRAILTHYDNAYPPFAQLDEHMLRATTILRLDVSEWTCKANIPQ